MKGSDEDDEAFICGNNEMWIEEDSSLQENQHDEEDNVYRRNQNQGSSGDLDDEDGEAIDDIIRRMNIGLEGVQLNASNVISECLDVMIDYYYY